MGSQIESIGIYHSTNKKGIPTFELVKRASDACLERSRYDRKDIDVLVHVSVYRTKEFVEPAMASYIQRDIGINHDYQMGPGTKTLSFDLINGSSGFLQGCQTISAMISANKVKTGLVVSGNSKNLTGGYSGLVRPYYEVGIATLLDETAERDRGFTSFHFRSFPEHIAAYEYHVEHRDKRWLSVIDISPNIENIYYDIYTQGIKEYLSKHGRDLSWYDYIVPPQVSSSFVSRIAETGGVDPDKYIDVTNDEGDLMTASESVAFERLGSLGLAKPGTKLLITNVGSGLQFGCASYVV
jgi:3-oxoacyl-[acyl-carrier-protein] synthase III